MRLPEGFTLIELLIAISIVAILSTIGLFAYSIFVKNARDVSRQANLKSIQSALEEYFADQVYYPTVGNTSCNRGSLRVDLPNCSLTDPDGTKTYMRVVPTDPVSSNLPYVYQSLPASCDDGTTKCTGYCLYAHMEQASGSNSAPIGCAFPAGYNFAVTKP